MIDTFNVDLTHFTLEVMLVLSVELLGKSKEWLIMRLLAGSVDTKWVDCILNQNQYHWEALLSILI